MFKQWIEDYVLLDRFSPKVSMSCPYKNIWCSSLMIGFTFQWKSMDNRAWFQASKIATDFRFVTLDLAHKAYMIRYHLGVHIWCVFFDISILLIQDYIMNLREVAELRNCGDLFFEIWKLVNKKSVSI